MLQSKLVTAVEVQSIPQLPAKPHRRVHHLRRSFWADVCPIHGNEQDADAVWGWRAGCVFLANSAFTQACVMWVTLIPLLFKFNRYAKARYGEAVSHMCALDPLLALAASLLLTLSMPQ